MRYGHGALRKRIALFGLAFLLFTGDAFSFAAWRAAENFPVDAEESEGYAAQADSPTGENGLPEKPGKDGATDAPPEEPPVYIPPGDVLPQVTARSAVVMDVLTGEVLYQRCMDERRYPASTTKIMSLITALEAGGVSFDDAVTVSAAAADMEGSTMWLERGQKCRFEDLLYGMMLVSGNDAAAAVAEHVSGSVPAFAKRMTEKAREIGAEHTRFSNSCGLHDPGHYTTAYDLALITAYGYQNPAFRKIVSTKERRVPLVKPPFFQNLENENMLLWIYRGANGVKTGYTDKAGRCVVTAAERDGVQLVSVVLDGMYMWNDSIAMLDYGFRNIEAREVVTKGEKMTSVPVAGGANGVVTLSAKESLRLPVPHGDMSAYRREIKTPHSVEAPIRRGDRIGEAVYYYKGKKVASVELTAESTVGRDDSLLAGWSRLWQKILRWFS